MLIHFRIDYLSVVQYDPEHFLIRFGNNGPYRDTDLFVNILLYHNWRNIENDADYEIIT